MYSDSDTAGLLSHRGKSFVHHHKKTIILTSLGLLALTILILGLVLGLRGNPSNSLPEHSLQDQFMNHIKGSNIREYMKEFSNVSHIAGSPADHAQAIATQAKLKSWGFETSIQEIPCLLTYPLSRRVEITYPADKKYVCSMEEPAVDKDPTSGKPAIATFNAYGASGDVTAELIYVNYGNEEDFIALEAMNMSVAGKIVIVRYGGVFRGNKVESAQRRGAVGVLIYSEPYVVPENEIYPNGPWRTNNTVQRGSVSLEDGDPQTPGWASTWNGPRLTVEQTKNSSYVTNPLFTIPVQPLSYGDATPLLAALGGKVAPPEWKGDLNITYHIGPGPVKVRLAVEVNYTVTPIWNVIGMMEGAEEPDRYVIIGCHRDAWTFGAGDPLSGHSVLLEIARAFSELEKTGWKPRRSIVIASWDAEEYALIGSVEFVEAHMASLSARAVSYINLDVSVTGGDYIGASGSFAFKTLFENLLDRVTLEGKPLKHIYDNDFSNIGGGSDYVAFIHHAGISVLDSRIGSANGQYGSMYHSNYDSFYWFDTFGDPEWIYHPALAKFLGLIAMEIADSPIIPFDLFEYAVVIQESISKLQKLAGSHELTNLKQSVNNLLRVTSQFMTEVKKEETLSPSTIRGLNDRIMFFERSFLSDDTQLTGGREWYKHTVYATSPDDWYGGVCFSPIGSAIAAKDWEYVDYLSGRIALIIDSAAEALLPKPFGVKL